MHVPMVVNRGSTLTTKRPKSCVVLIAFLRELLQGTQKNVAKVIRTLQIPPIKAKRLAICFR